MYVSNNPVVAVHSEVVVSDEELLLSLLVIFALARIALVQGEQEVVHSFVEVVHSPVQAAPANVVRRAARVAVDGVRYFQNCIA